MNRSYKYNENIARTGISTLNGHISETVQNFEKLKKRRFNYLSEKSLIIGFENFWYRKKYQFRFFGIDKSFGFGFTQILGFVTRWLKVCFGLACDESWSG